MNQSTPLFPSSLKRVTPPVRMCLIGFLVDFCVMIGILALPFYVYNQLGGGVAMSGAIGAFQAAFYAIVCLLSAGFVTRAKNGLNWAILGVALFAVSTVIMPFTPGPVSCCLIACISMGSLSIVWPALHSWVGAEPNLQLRARNMSWFNISWSFGFSMSPLFAGPLYDLDYRLPFALLFLICIPILILLRSMPSDKEFFKIASGKVEQNLEEEREDHNRASESHLYAAWIGTTLGAAFVGVTRTVFPKQIEDLVSAGQLRVLFESTPPAFLTAHAATKYSWLAFLLAFATAMTFLVMGRSNRWHHNFALNIAIQLAAMASFLILGKTHSLAVMMSSFVIIGIMSGYTFFCSVFYGMADNALKHRRAAINEGGVGFGGFAGSILFGWLAARQGIAQSFLFIPFFALVAILIQLMLLHVGTKKFAQRP